MTPPMTPEAQAYELEVAAQRVLHAMEDRDEEIRKAYAAGTSPAAIAEAVGLTRQRVWQIVRAGS